MVFEKSLGKFNDQSRVFNVKFKENWSKKRLTFIFVQYIHRLLFLFQTKFGFSPSSWLQRTVACYRNVEVKFSSFTTMMVEKPKPGLKYKITMLANDA